MTKDIVSPKNATAADCPTCRFNFERPPGHFQLFLGKEPAYPDDTVHQKAVESFKQRIKEHKEMMESRELDARVAREVYGLIDHEKDGAFLRMKTPDGQIVVPPFFSDGIKTAMEVEQKMCDLGWCEFTLIHHPQGMWTAMFMNGPDSAEADAYTPARAICLAALDAVESTR